MRSKDLMPQFCPIHRCHFLLPGSHEDQDRKQSLIFVIANHDGAVFQARILDTCRKVLY